jgi:hypothetical protein
MNISSCLNDGSRAVGIEIAGRPYAGKTTLARGLARSLRESGVQCDLIEEAWPHFPEPDWKLRWEFSAWTMMETIGSIIEHMASSANHVLVVDKGLIDVQCWFEWFRMRGLLTESMAGQLTQWSRLSTWYEQIDTVLVLDASYDVAVRRRQGVGRIVNATTFRQLEVAYDRVLSEVAVPVEVRRTDDITPQETLKWALDVVNRFQKSGAINRV